MYFFGFWINFYLNYKNVIQNSQLWEIFALLSCRRKLHCKHHVS